MRILLTGSSGLIGQQVQTLLLAEGHHLLCAGRSTPAFSHPRLRHLAADFRTDIDPALWLPRLRDIDVVINTVGIFREAGAQTFARIHSEAPCALFAACAASDSVRLVIQLSALGADQDADTAYLRSKRAADAFLATLPVRAFIVQPSLVYGRNGASSRLFRSLASMPFGVQFGTAAQTVQPIHVDDVGAAIATLLRQPPPVAADGATARRIALVGPSALPFTAYLAALRRGMGMTARPTLRLPGWIGHLAASARIGWFDRDALRMLDRGSSADPAPTARLLGRTARAVDTFIDHPAAERAQAKLGWLLPPLRWSIALVWIATAIVSAAFYPHALSVDLLVRTGIPSDLAPLTLFAACALDLAFGIGTLLLRRRRWLWRAQLGLIGLYTVIIAWCLPEFVVHPYGPLTKNLPMLAAIWLLAHLEEA